MTIGVEIENTLLKETKRHCAAFFFAWNFGDIYFRNESDDYILEQGTLTFIEYKGECYAITNQHVIGDDYEERLKTNSLMVALDRHSFWGINPIFVSPAKEKQDLFYPPNFPKDIAIFPFSNSRSKLIKANKELIDLQYNLPVINHGEVVLTVGFPGEEREVVSKETCGHRLAHVFGTVQSASDHSIMIQDNNPKRDKDISFGGMSGGPIFRIDENDGSYKFIGLNYEGKGFKRKNEQNELEVGDDFWIFGFPFFGQLFEEILNFKCK